MATPRRHSTLWAYLWDLVEDGISEVVTRCRDELGLDALSVATAYHTYQQLRPRAGTQRLRIADQAAVYFVPDGRFYCDTPIRPPVARLALDGNPLAQLADACHSQGVGLISWTVCLHTSFLAARYPEFAQRTAHGDSLGWILCPGEDAVRAYLVGLCKDLAANYGICRLELEMVNFGTYGHAHHHVKDGVDLGPIGNYLLSLSFSSGCVAKAEQAGIDARALARWVREQLEPVLATGQPLDGDLAEFVAAYPDLDAYQALREEIVTSLVAEIRQATGVETSVILMGDRWRAGLRLDRLAEATDLVETLAYLRDPNAVASRIGAVLAELDDPSRLVLGLQAYPPAARSADDLRACTERALSLGVTRHSYYNYGIAPPACLGWVTECTRLAEA